MRKYTKLEEVHVAYRGDTINTLKPYAGIAVFRDGRYIIASRDRGRLVMVGADDLVICSADPFAEHVRYKNLVCYGIALHTNEQALYLLVGEAGGVELYIAYIEILPDSTFKWVTRRDLRLPSVAAMNKNNTEFPLIEWEDRYPELQGYVIDEDGNAEFITIPWDPEKDDLSEEPPEGFDVETAKWVRQTGDIADINRDWYEKIFTMEDPVEYQSLGPIMPEYKPCLAGIGSRLLVSCVNAQLHVQNYEIAIPFNEDIGQEVGIDPKQYFDSDTPLRDAYRDYLKELLMDKGLIETDEEPEWQPGDKLEEIARGLDNESPISILDVLMEGKDAWWWVDEENQIIHHRFTFQMGFPVLSYVVVHPDIGTIDSITHISGPHLLPYILPIVFFSEDAAVEMFAKRVDYTPIPFKTAEPFGFNQSVAFWDDDCWKNYIESLDGKKLYFGQEYDPTDPDKKPTPIDFRFFLHLLDWWIVEHFARYRNDPSIPDWFDTVGYFSSSHKANWAVSVNPLDWARRVLSPEPLNTLYNVYHEHELCPSSSIATRL